MLPSRERFYLSQEYSKIMNGEAPWPEGYPYFKPLTYSLDVMLPFVDLGQETHWRPKSKPQFLNSPVWYNRFHLLAGWFLSTIAVLGFSGLIKDRDSD